VQPQDVSYIEVSGSGSEVTDLLELKAIESAYGPRMGHCNLGSMKPNIGHPLSAEGIASFVKVVLMLHHRRMVPFLSGEEPMRHFDFDNSPFGFSRVSVPWDGARLAAINSFADGGTNVHVVLRPWEAKASERILRQPIPPPVLHRIDLGSPECNSDVDEVTETAMGEGVSDSDFWVPLTLNHA
jgi:acyl transferase domain-containing protein